MIQGSAESSKYNILITRPKYQAENLCQLLEQQGCNAIRFPTLELVALENASIRQQLTTLGQYHWLIFISANAVNFALRANNGRIDTFEHHSIVAVGKATENALKTVGLAVRLIPEQQFNTEGILETPEMNNVAGQSCLIIRGQGGREALANSLRKRGAQVHYMEVYSRKRPANIDASVMQLLRLEKINAITMTSGDALNNMMAMIDIKLHKNLYLIPIIVISHRLKELAEGMGFKHITVTKRPDNSAITETVLLSLNSAIN